MLTAAPRARVQLCNTLLPACAKHAQTLQGVTAGHPARPDAARLARPATGDPDGAARAGLNGGRMTRSTGTFPLDPSDASILLAPVGELEMASVLVRDLDPAVVDRLKARAEENGRSLQKELKTLLEQAAAQVTWAEARANIERVRKRFAGRQFSDSSELIREQRDR